MAAIIDGLNGYIQGRIRSLGSQAIFVTRIPPGYTGLSRLPANIRARKYLRFDDGQYLMETVPSLSTPPRSRNASIWAKWSTRLPTAHNTWNA